MTSLTEDQITLLVKSPQQFPISFDDAWRWLEFSTKGNAKRAFESAQFHKGVDYEATTGDVKTFKSAMGIDFKDVFGFANDELSKGGRPTEIIRLTNECFKSFSLACGTAKGKEVRLYFLQCERKLREIEAVASNPQVQPVVATTVLPSKQANLVECIEAMSKIPDLDITIELKELTLAAMEIELTKVVNSTLELASFNSTNTSTKLELEAAVNKLKSIEAVEEVKQLPSASEHGIPPEEMRRRLAYWQRQSLDELYVRNQLELRTENLLQATKLPAMDCIFTWADWTGSGVDQYEGVWYEGEYLTKEESKEQEAKDLANRNN